MIKINVLKINYWQRTMFDPDRPETRKNLEKQPVDNYVDNFAILVDNSAKSVDNSVDNFLAQKSYPPAIPTYPPKTPTYPQSYPPLKVS